MEKNKQKIDNQTLLVGLGGTGSRIISLVAQELNEKDIVINDGKVGCVVIDTNENDRKNLRQENRTIPIIGTSRQRQIEEYLEMYESMGVREWMPESPELNKQSMVDGASQMRVKSRLAFYDFLKGHPGDGDNGKMTLEETLNKLLINRDSNTLRVLVVSSLGGGTGSGMFIQMGLWLRKFFSERNTKITLRGIFILPDVFIRTVENIKKNPVMKRSIYANAYAALRELNALNKIKLKGYSPLQPMKVDDLFDSDKDRKQGEPVYNYTFFVDDITMAGFNLNTIDQYQRVIARLVYMQLYAPMHDNMYSEEDNLFRSFQESDEPMFGTCGTSKAVYPTKDIIDYCALCASRDSVSAGWQKIDKEVDEKVRQEKEREKRGIISNKKINKRQEYVRLYLDKTSRTGNQVGVDRLFAGIANDIKNETRYTNEEGETLVEYRDKVSDFMDELDQQLTSVIDTKCDGDLAELRVKKGWEDQSSEDIPALKKLVDQKEKKVASFLDYMDEISQSLADELVDRICPVDMGDINMRSDCSVYSFLTKLNNDDQPCFIHPLAARYLLYALRSELDGVKNTIDLDHSRTTASKGYGDGYKKITFDNPGTRFRVEDSARDYLESKKKTQNLTKFVLTFKKLYVQFNKAQHELCRKYAIQKLKADFIRTFFERLEKLTKKFEAFFKNLNLVINTVNQEIEKNIERNRNRMEGVIYISAEPEDKENIYRSLSIDFSESNEDINKILIDSIYGTFCAEMNESADNNKPYLNRSVESAFYNNVVRTYRELILKDNTDALEMDIYSAIGRKTRWQIESQRQADRRDHDDPQILDVDLSTGMAVEKSSTLSEQLMAFAEVLSQLKKLSSPFLLYQDTPANQNTASSQTGAGAETEDAFESDTSAALAATNGTQEMVFWGYHPKLLKSCPQLGSLLQTNAETSNDKAYLKNELYCYRAVYGITAEKIDKFNELKKGMYYRNYKEVIDKMVTDGKPETLVLTPHLDKTWHLFLPYVTPEKQQQDDAEFFRNFWLSLAYGLLSVSEKGVYQMGRTKKTATGSYTVSEQLLCKGKPVPAGDIFRLLSALKTDPLFMLEAHSLKPIFESECEPGKDALDSRLLRGHFFRDIDDESRNRMIGGLMNTDLTNAVTVIAAYTKHPNSSDDVAASLVLSLELLIKDLIRSGYSGDQQAELDRCHYRILAEIYKASDADKADIEMLNPWKYAWAQDELLNS